MGQAEGINALHITESNKPVRNWRILPDDSEVDFIIVTRNPTRELRRVCLPVAVSNITRNRYAVK